MTKEDKYAFLASLVKSYNDMNGGNFALKHWGNNFMVSEDVVSSANAWPKMLTYLYKNGWAVTKGPSNRQIVCELAKREVVA